MLYKKQPEGRSLALMSDYRLIEQPVEVANASKAARGKAKVIKESRWMLNFALTETQQYPGVDDPLPLERWKFGGSGPWNGNIARRVRCLKTFIELS